MTSTCLQCGAATDIRLPLTWLTEKSHVGCAACRTRIVPGRKDDEVTVTLRWQELRLLVGLAAASVEREPDLAPVFRDLCARLSRFRPPLVPPLTSEQLIEELRLQGIDARLIDSAGKDWPTWG